MKRYLAFPIMLPHPVSYSVTVAHIQKFPIKKPKGIQRSTDRA